MPVSSAKRSTRLQAIPKGAISFTLPSKLACRSTPPHGSPSLLPCPVPSVGVTESHWAVPEPRTSGTSPLLSSGRGQLPDVDGRERHGGTAGRSTWGNAWDHPGARAGRAGGARPLPPPHQLLSNCSPFSSVPHSHLPLSRGNVCTCRLGPARGWGLPAGRVWWLGPDHRRGAGGHPHGAERVRSGTVLGEGAGA